MMPRIAEGPKCNIDSSRNRSGHRIMLITLPSATSLKMPLAKFAAACLPNTRLAPEAGEILLKEGLSDSADHTSRCCSMLPAIAEMISIKSGTPSAPISTYSRFRASFSRLGPSVWSIHALASRLRNGISIEPIDPENDDNTNVAPAIMNQVLTSWLLATSPRSSASSRRFCVGSSVLSEESSSSAIVGFSATLGLRRQIVHDADEVVEEGAHHRDQHQREDQEAGEDRQRHADEIDLHLRHQPRQYAEPDVEHQSEHQERRRQLHADPERGGEGAGGERCDIAARHQVGGRKDVVAVVQRRDHKIVAVGGEQQRHAEHGEEVSDQDALLALGRIEGGDESQPHLLGDHRA